MLVFHFYYKIISNIYYVSFILGLSIYIMNQRKYIELGISHNLLLNLYFKFEEIDLFRDLPTDSQTTDITHFAVVFNYDVTIEALEILRSTTNAYDVKMKNNGKVRDVRSLACKIKVLNGRVPGT